MESKSRTRDLTLNVVDVFKKKFLSEEIRPGQTLPSERDLAAQLNVGRSTIREAVIALKVMGLVEMKQGKRATVTTPSVNNVLEILSLVTPLDQTTILNLLELRELFEPPCVSLATKRATPRELQMIKMNLDDMARSTDDLDAFFKADYEFHRSIMRATRNDMILIFYTVFRPLLESLARRMVETSQEKSVHERATIEHERVLQAIWRGEAELASSLVRDVILSSKDRYLRMLLDQKYSENQSAEWTSGEYAASSEEPGS